MFQYSYTVATLYAFSFYVLIHTYIIFTKKPLIDQIFICVRADVVVVVVVVVGESFRACKSASVYVRVRVNATLRAISYTNKNHPRLY